MVAYNDPMRFTSCDVQDRCSLIERAGRPSSDVWGKLVLDTISIGYICLANIKSTVYAFVTRVWCRIWYFFVIWEKNVDYFHNRNVLLVKLPDIWYGNSFFCYVWKVFHCHIVYNKCEWHFC